MHVDGDRLQDFVDRRLDGVEREMVRQHIARCERCAAEVRSLEALTTDLASMASPVLPGRDLLPDIRFRIDTAAGADRRAASRARRRTQLRAAAVGALIISSSAVTAVVLGRSSERDGSVSLRQSETATLLQVHADYARAAEELEALLRERRAELPSGTVETLERSLSVIDAALNEARTALESDPGNPILSDMLLAGYEKKLDVLRRATTFPSL